MPVYLDSPAHAPFHGAAASFFGLVETLVGVGSGADDHATIEKLIHKEGTEVLRQLLEVCLNQRAAAVEGDQVEGADGVVRTHHRSGARQVETLFGTVVVTRDRLGARGVAALVPADASLNLPADRFSFGVRERVVTEAIRGSYDDAVAAVVATTGALVAKRQAEELVDAAALDFDAFYDALARDPPELRVEGSLMVLSVDGKGIVMRPEGLREQTRKAAAKGSHKLRGRLSKGEKRNRKRMATVAAVYELEVQPRSVDDILGDLRGGVREKRPRAHRKRVWASVEKSASDVIREAFDEVQARDPDGHRPLVALVDGNAVQIREIRSQAKKRGLEVTLVLDLIHVVEYLWGAAWNVFNEGDPQAKKWVDRYLRMILEGRASAAAAAIRRCATNRGLIQRKGIDSAADYLLGHADMLRYHQYLAQGMPIATGVIEGACRHLVKDRMDITGARWGLRGAEAVLRLRSLHSSGDLSDYFDFHRAQEAQRNHLQHYAGNVMHWTTKAAA